MCEKKTVWSDGLRDRLALDTDILAQASRHGTRVRGTATIHLSFALLPGWYDITLRPDYRALSLSVSVSVLLSWGQSNLPSKVTRE